MYCSHCGQKAEIERITFHYIWHQVLHFFTHAEKGFLFTSWRMLAAPGRTVKNFIEGKRMHYQAPVSYYLIWNAVYILLLYLVGKSFGDNKAVNFAHYFGPSEKTQYALSHLNIVLTALLPFQAFYVYLIMVYRVYNYFESLVAVFYAIGTVLMLQFAFVVLAIPVFLLSGVSANIQLSDILKVLYIGWFMIDFVKLLPVKHKFIKAIIVMLLAFGTFTVWRLYVFPAVAELFFS
jgi:hypothetical protein